MEVRQRRPLRIPDIAPTADPGLLPRDQRDRQILVEVRIAVADSGTVEEQRRVEHRPVPLRRLGQPLHQMRKLLEVVLVDQTQPLEIDRPVLVMRQRVMRIRDPDLRIGP